MSGTHGLLRTLRRIEGYLVLLSVACCVLILVLTNVDIAARAIGRSIYLGSELNSMLFSLLIYWAAPEVTRRNDHIRLTFIYNYTSRFVSDSIRRINSILSAIFFIAIAYLFYRFSAINYSNGMRTQGLLNLPVYYVQFAVFAGIALTALRFAINAVVPVDAEELSDPSSDSYIS